MKTKRFIHNDLGCEYNVHGKGPRVLYCYHGFGGSFNDWSTFMPWLEDAFTIYSFNDFFHGSSDFPLDRINSDPLTKSELSAFYVSFALHHGHDEINLMAYSSGGRTVISILEEGEMKIDEVWLFASDGIQISFWNRLFCNYSSIQRLYFRLIEKPEAFFKSLKILTDLNLISRDLSKFVFYSMRNEEKRRLLYKFWMTYRKIRPDRKRLIVSINKSVAKLHFVMGSKDKVIPAKIAYKFKKELAIYCDVLLIDTGHLLIEERNLDLLREKFPLK